MVTQGPSPRLGVNEAFRKKRLYERVPLLVALMTLPFCGQAIGAEEKENVVPQDVFDGMRESFRAEKAKGVQARYQFDLSGPAGGQWWIDVQDGKFKMGKGTIANPGVTLSASDQDWVALSNGNSRGGGRSSRGD